MDECTLLTDAPTAPELRTLSASFQQFIDTMQNHDAEVKKVVSMAEIDSILREELVDVAEYLESFASGKKVGKFRARLNGVLKTLGAKEFVDAQTKLVKRAATEGMSIDELLDKIFLAFKQKQENLVEVFELAENLRTALTAQELQLEEYIAAIEQHAARTTSSVDKLKCLQMVTLARAMDISVKEKLYNKIAYVQGFSQQLIEKLGTLMPVMKSQLSDEFAISGALASIRETTAMMDAVIKMSNAIAETNSKEVHELIVGVSDAVVETGLNVDFLEGAHQRNEAFQKKMIECTQRNLERTISQYKRLTDLSTKCTSSITRAAETERQLLESALSRVKTTLPPDNTDAFRQTKQ